MHNLFCLQTINPDYYKNMEVVYIVFILTFVRF